MNGDEIRIVRASVRDVPAIAALVERYVRRGEVLPRPLEDIYQSLREWVVAKRHQEVVGCASLVILWADLAEIRSLVVLPELQGKGIGRQLVCALLDEAAALEIRRVIALTRKPAFFAQLGFVEVPRASLPRKIWKDCIHCTKFAGCDEVAMVYELPLAPHMEQASATPHAIAACHAPANAIEE